MATAITILQNAGWVVVCNSSLWLPPPCFSFTVVFPFVLPSLLLLWFPWLRDCVVRVCCCSVSFMMLSALPTFFFFFFCSLLQWCLGESKQPSPSGVAPPCPLSKCLPPAHHQQQQFYFFFCFLLNNFTRIQLDQRSREVERERSRERGREVERERGREREREVER